jgi:hypothetical protein
MDIEPGELYFVRELDPHTKKFTNFVKIGLVREREGRTSLDRLTEHQTGNPRQLVLPTGNYFKTHAINRVESMMHKIFATQRISGEWFEFANEKEIESAKQRGLELSKEVAGLLKVFTAAKELETKADDGTPLKANAKATELRLNIAIATSKKKLLQELSDELGSKLRVAVERGDDVKGVATTQDKTYEGAFDLEAFAAENPKLYKKYLLVKHALKQSFLLKPLKLDESSLGSDFLGLIKDLKKQIDSATAKTPEKLNMPKLVLTTEIAILDWDIEVWKAQLKKLCGSHQEITGICTWKRAEVTTEVFDKSTFKKEQAELYAKYVGESTTKTYVQVTKKKLN